LTEIFVDRALARAKEVDDYLKATGKPIGALHGLPISLKDQFPIKGLETIMGYAGWIGRYADSDCVLVEILYEQGAVPFVRTNVPQTLVVRVLLAFARNICRYTGAPNRATMQPQKSNE